MAKLMRTVGETGRILLVDDEEMVRKAVHLILGFCGYEVVEAVDGEDAVQKYIAASPPFDLIVIDVDMPRLGGAEALTRIRDHQPDAKAILLSGGVHTGDLERIHFLQKPFDNQELLGLIRQTLDAEA